MRLITESVSPDQTVSLPKDPKAPLDLSIAPPTITTVFSWVLLTNEEPSSLSFLFFCCCCFTYHHVSITTDSTPTRYDCSDTTASTTKTSSSSSRCFLVFHRDGQRQVVQQYVFCCCMSSFPGTDITDYLLAFLLACLHTHTISCYIHHPHPSLSAHQAKRVTVLLNQRTGRKIFLCTKPVSTPKAFVAWPTGKPSSILS